VSRVNRPYKSPNGYIFKFGYIVDFVDIEKEYDATLAEYIKELEYEIKESDDTAPPLIGVVVDSKFVYEDYQKFKAELDSYHLETNNAEIFTQQIMLYNKDALIKLKNSLSGMKKAYMELLMSRSEEYIKLIGNDNVTNLLKCVNDRLSFLNIKEDPIGELVTLPGAEIGKIIYEFQKVKENLLDIGPSSQMDEDFANLRNILLAIRLELKKNENENDPQLKILNDWLMNVFDKLNDSTLDDVEVIIDEALEVLTEIKKINKENEIFIGKFDGNPAYLKTYHFISKNYNLDNDIINQILEVIFEDISEINNQILISQGRQNFINRINEEYQNNPENLQDYRKMDMIVLNLQRACEAVLDLAMYVVSNRKLGLPQNKREAFKLLEENNIIDSNLCKNMQGMIGFRNIAVHDYKEISEEILQSVIENNLSYLTDFARIILNLE